MNLGRCGVNPCGDAANRLANRAMCGASWVRVGDRSPARGHAQYQFSALPAGCEYSFIYRASLRTQIIHTLQYGVMHSRSK